MTLSKVLQIILSCVFTMSCVLNHPKKEQQVEVNNYFTRVRLAQCTPDEKPMKYKIGEMPCARKTILISTNEKLEIHFVVANEASEDPYEYGYQELLRYKDRKVIEKMKLRWDEDAYWSDVPFVRLRQQKFLADLDGDGYKEFAVLPFHPGSAIWMTARIFSLKEKITFWGTGRYQYEGDSFVRLNCPRCSKFDAQACETCE